LTRGFWVVFYEFNLSGGRGRGPGLKPDLFGGDFRGLKPPANPVKLVRFARRAGPPVGFARGQNNWKKGKGKNGRKQVRSLRSE